MKTTFTALRDNHCVAKYDTILGDPVERHFFAPFEGGYVCETDDDGYVHQVCDRLSSRGPTLYWHPSSHPRLIDLIRKEYRAMRRADQKYSH